MPGQGRTRDCCTWRRRSWSISASNSPRRRVPPSSCLVTAAILSRPGFDARTVDPATVRLGRAEEIHRNKHGVIRTWRTSITTATSTSCCTSTSTTRAWTATPTGRRSRAGPSRPAHRHDGYARFGRDFAMAQDWEPRRRPELLVLRHGQRLHLKVQVKDNARPTRARGTGSSSGTTSSAGAAAAGPTRTCSRPRSATAAPAASPDGATASLSTTPTIPPTRPPTGAATW